MSCRECLNSNDDIYTTLFQMRVVGILRSPDKTQRRERADDEDKNSDPKRGRVHGIPVRLDGRDDGLDARLRQSEAAVAPVSGPEVQEAPSVRSFQPIGVDRRVARPNVAEDRAPG